MQGLRGGGLRAVPEPSKNPRFSLFFKHFGVIMSLGPSGLKSGFGRMTGCVTDSFLCSFLPRSTKVKHKVRNVPDVVHREGVPCPPPERSSVKETNG
jgi:hypothetical protein